MPEPQGCSRDISFSCLQRAEEALCPLNTLESLSGAVWWQIKEESARGERVCPCVCDCASRGGGARTPIGLLGPREGCRARQGARMLCRIQAWGPPVPTSQCTDPVPAPKTIPKPKSTPEICTGLVPAPLLLFQGTGRVPWRAPRERQGLSHRDSGWPWGHRLSASARRTEGLSWVSLLIFCAASPSARRPQWLWQPHLFTG